MIVLDDRCTLRAGRGCFDNRRATWPRANAFNDDPLTIWFPSQASGGGLMMNAHDIMSKSAPAGTGGGGDPTTLLDDKVHNFLTTWANGERPSESLEGRIERKGRETLRVKKEKELERLAALRLERGSHEHRPSEVSACAHRAASSRARACRRRRRRHRLRRRRLLRARGAPSGRPFPSPRVVHALTNDDARRRRCGHARRPPRRARRGGRGERVGADVAGGLLVLVQRAHRRGDDDVPERRATACARRGGRGAACDVQGHDRVRAWHGRTRLRGLGLQGGWVVAAASGATGGRA